MARGGGSPDAKPIFVRLTKQERELIEKACMVRFKVKSPNGLLNRFAREGLVWWANETIKRSKS